MQEINKPIDILTSIDSLEKEICFFLLYGDSSSGLAYLLYIQSDIHTFKLSPWHRGFNFFNRFAFENFTP